MRYLILLLLPLCLTACAEVVSETEGTFVYNGKTLRAVTREYSADGRTFTKRVIYTGRHPVSCSATDDLDCRAAIVFENIDRND